MSLQRRLLLYLLLCAPLVRPAAVSVQRPRHEVNELFDSEMMRLAQQLQATLIGLHALGQPTSPTSPAARAGDADPRELAVAVWDAQGRLLWSGHENARLP